MRVPFADLAAQEATVAKEVLSAVASVAQGAEFVLGAHVEAFERWLAEACSVSHAVGVASGTDAIELALRAVGIGPGDAVVTPAFSFIAPAEAVAAIGARPVFCDVDATSMNATGRTMGAAVERARRAGWRIRALLPVHLFGRCVPLGELTALAREEGLALVEDAAQAIGARDESGRPPGAVATAACFSFFPAKNLGAWGDGGAVVTSDAGLAAHVRRLRAHGAVSPFVYAELGRNSRLDALQAAVLLAKARHLESWQQARDRVARRYLRELAGFPLVLPPSPTPPAVHAWHAFVVRVPERRDALSAWLDERQIETRVYYPVPLHRQACFHSLDEPALAVAEEVCRTALALPMFTTITEQQQGRVIEQIEGFFERA
jgi:dTDP-4-amino-4,6-dideoxygalactose transaminase